MYVFISNLSGSLGNISMNRPLIIKLYKKITLLIFINFNIAIMSFQELLINIAQI